MATQVTIGHGDYNSKEEEDETGERQSNPVRAQPQLLGTELRLTSRDFTDSGMQAVQAAASRRNLTHRENNGHNSPQNQNDDGDDNIYRGHAAATRRSPERATPAYPVGQVDGMASSVSSSSDWSTWTPAANPNAPRRYTGERPKRTVPADINSWFLHHLGYAVDWARKCAKRRRERVGARELASVPCFDWAADAEASRQSCNDAASCLAAGLAEWEPLPQEFINSRAKALSDISALSKRKQMFMRDVAAHGAKWPAAAKVCAAFEEAVAKNQECLRARRDIIRHLGSEHIDTLTTVLSNSDWQCGRLHTALADIAAYYETTKSDIAKEFNEPSTELRMRSRAIRRAADDLRGDVRESRVLSSATMAALDAVAESSADGLDMDQLSYMRRELTSERDRLARQSYTLGDERRDHEEMQSRLHKQFDDMNVNLDTLHKRRSELVDEKSAATNAQDIARLELDLLRIERQIGEQGTKMAETMRLKQWTREESTSRVAKQDLVTQWLDRLTDLHKVLEDAARVQGETASRHHEYMSVLDTEVRKTLLDLQQSYEKSAADVENRVVKQLALHVDALPADVQEATLAETSRRNAHEMTLSVSRHAVENPALRTLKHDVDKLNSVARELIQAQTLAAKMINFEEILTTLKQMWALVWAHDKKN